MSEKLEIERAMALAIEQLRDCRRANDILQARCDTLDLLSAFLFATPPPRGSQGMGEDAAWLLQRELDRMRVDDSRIDEPVSVAKANPQKHRRR